MKSRLHDCWSKLRWAKENTEALQNYVRETFSIESNRPRFGIKFDVERRDYLLFVNHMPDVSESLERASLAVGDIAKNLRSALDFLTYQLAWLHTKGNIVITRSSRSPGPPEQDVDMAGYAAPSIAFSDGRGVIPVINKIAAVIVKIVGEFEPFFES